MPWYDDYTVWSAVPMTEQSLVDNRIADGQYGRHEKYVFVKDNPDGTLEGRGTVCLLRHMRAKGSFRRGMLNGEGELFTPTGALEFKGTFRDDKCHGPGTSLRHGKEEHSFYVNGENVYTKEAYNQAISEEAPQCQTEPQRRTYTPIWQDLWSRSDYVFVGDDPDGTLNGQGRLFPVSTIIYRGELNKDGLFHGEGTFFNGSKLPLYTGEFFEGAMHGQGKLYDQRDLRKVRYEGQFVNGRFHGKGTEYDNSSGFLREGEFVDGKLHGPGSVTDLASNIVYAGEWKDGLMCDGKGTIQGNGRTYEGEVTCGSGFRIKSIPQGSGTMTWDCGTVIQGKWKKGLCHGKATWTSSSGLVTYVGNWKEGVKHGKGKIMFTQGRSDQDVVNTGTSFEGRWENGHPVGDISVKGSPMGADSHTISAAKLLAMVSEREREQKAMSSVSVSVTEPASKRHCSR